MNTWWLANGLLENWMMGFVMGDENAYRYWSCDGIKDYKSIYGISKILGGKVYCQNWMTIIFQVKILQLAKIMYYGLD